MAQSRPSNGVEALFLFLFFPAGMVGRPAWWHIEEGSRTCMHGLTLVVLPTTPTTHR